MVMNTVPPPDDYDDSFEELLDLMEKHKPRKVKAAIPQKIPNITGKQIEVESKTDSLWGFSTIGDQLYL